MQKEYEEINLIDYIITIKKQFRGIVKITIAFIILALIITLGIPSQNQYDGELSLLVGTIQGKPIQAPEEMSALVFFYNSNVSAKKSESPRLFTLTSKGSSSQEVKNNLEKTGALLIAQHEEIFKKKIKTVDDQIQTLGKNIKENDELVLRFGAMVNRLSPYDQAQALSLQAYLSSYVSSLSMRKMLQNDIQKIEQEKFDYEETKIPAPPIITQSGRIKNIPLNGFLGALLGILLGIFWAFTKEWWETNKKLLK